MLPKPAIGATIAIAALLEVLPAALAVEEPVAFVELPVVVPVAAGTEDPAEEAEASACSQMSAAAGATSGHVLAISASWSRGGW